MKVLYTLASIVILFCLPALPGTSAVTPAPSSVRQHTNNYGDIAQLLKVAVAKEPIYLILVEKDLQRLRVIEYGQELKVVADYPSATGENFGIKEISGDSKTPEGVYFITQIFRDDKITIFGDKAFHLDYPNFFDQEAGRDGNGIYIHGTNKELEPNSTNGCVTLTNSDLDNLGKYLNQVVTPVVIVPALESVKTDMNMLTDKDFRLAKSLLLLDGLNPKNIEYNYLYVVSYGGQTVAVSDFNYRPFSNSIMRGASRTYLKYLPEKGWTSAKRIWRASPLQIFPEAPIKVDVQPFTDEIQLAEQNLQETAALVASLSAAAGPEENTVGNRKQDMIQQSTAVAASLVSGKTGDKKAALPESAKQEVKKTPVARSVPTPSPLKETGKKIVQQQKMEVRTPSAVLSKQQIIDFVENWRQAWISRQIEPYIDFYDSSFRSGDKDLREWKEYKAKLNQTYTYISVDITDININWTDAGATVSFKQQYRSDLYSATGIKTLYLVYNDPGWKIRRETFSRQ